MGAVTSAESGRIAAAAGAPCLHPGIGPCRASGWAVVPLPGVGEERNAVTAADAAHHIESLFGIRTDVVVRPPGAIARSHGKAVRVRDLRPKGA